MPEILLSASDRLFLFGHGLFETILITTKGPAFLELHRQRLLAGSKILGLQLPEFEIITSALSEYLNEQKLLPPYALRLTISGGSPEHEEPPRFFFSTRLLPYTPDHYLNGLSLHLLPWRKNELSPLTKAKTVNYSENYLGKKEALRHGYDEGLWLNSHDFLSEGTMSNLFYVRNSELFTPDLECGCLPGTRREIIRRLAFTIGLTLHEGKFTLEDLLQAEEVFLTNALMGIIPVQRLDGTTFKVSAPDDQASISRILTEAYKRLF